MSDRRSSAWTPRRAFAAITIVLGFALVGSWTSLSARAGGGATTQTVPAAAPQPSFAVQTGIVYPLELPPPTVSVGGHSRPLRVADPAGYSQRKAAVESGATLAEVPSLATLALATTPTVSTNFAGLASGDSQCGPGCEPPDTQVAAGPDNIVEVTNIVERVFDKSGNVLSTFNLNELFNVPLDIFSSDPRIEYDTISQRWLISLLTLDNTDVTNSHNGYFNLAVSSDSNPLDGFNTYSIETLGAFPDQPSLGFNDDKVVTGGNSFSCNPDCSDGPYEGNEFIVWNKSELLAGDATIDTNFHPPVQDTSGFPIIPAKSRSSTSTLFMVSAFDTELNIWSVTGVPGVDGSSATKTTAMVTAFTDPPNAQQENGSGNPINTGDSRLQDAVFRDGHLWASGDDACKPPGDTTTRSCIHYFEVLTGGTSPSVRQDFSFGTKDSYDYYPSVDLDSSDDLITSFTQSSSAEFASAFVDGRLAGDPTNTLGTPVRFHKGAKTYKGTRWGDYSGAGVDPADETAIWVASEYATNASSGLNWSTWIAEARVESPVASPTPTATATATATSTGTPTATASATPTATPTATATPVGRLSVSTSELSFGAVKVNSSKRKKFKVQNKGKFPLQVTIGTLAPPFTVIAGSGLFTLHTGEKKKVIVQFKPTATGATAPQTLSITSDDPSHPSHDVSASGSGK